MPAYNFEASSGQHDGFLSNLYKFTAGSHLKVHPKRSGTRKGTRLGLKGTNILFVGLISYDLKYC